VTALYEGRAKGVAQPRVVGGSVEVSPKPDEEPKQADAMRQAVSTEVLTLKIADQIAARGTASVLK